MEKTNYIKAMHILARLAKICRRGVFLTADDILNKVTTEQELDFYYKWCK